MSIRLGRLREELARRGLDAFLSFDAVTNAYLSGFTGSTSVAIVTADRAILITDFRYREQACAEVKSFDLHEASDSYMRGVCGALSDIGARKVAFEPERMTFKSYQDVRDRLSTVELVGVQDLVSKLRASKDSVEQENIRRAAAIASDVMREVPAIARTGISERELAAEIEYLIRKNGADGPAFDALVLFGERSSLPHGKPSDRRLEDGDIVLVDIGAKCNGYNSDLTRTWVYRRISATRAKEVYEIVKSAQKAALDFLKAGVWCAELDAEARSIIRESGYSDNFGHGLGHGVGLEVHESPRISAQSTDKIQENMVVTIEPGIYLPGEGGVRIEDLVLVTATGCEVLTEVDKTFTII
jgi:Xaa-Pro aminopeptidase